MAYIALGLRKYSMCSEYNNILNVFGKENSISYVVECITALNTLKKTPARTKRERVSAR